MNDCVSVSNENYELRIYRDEHADSPREWENMGKMVCWHRRYTLGDKHDYDSPQDFYESDEYKNAFAILPFISTTIRELRFLILILRIDLIAGRWATYTRAKRA